MVIENLFQSIEESEFVPKTVVHLDGSVSKGECRIVREHGIELFLNEKLTMKLVCTPSNLTELIIGRLISEGYIESTDEIDMIYICSSGQRARVFLKDATGEAMKLVQAVEEIPTCCTDNQVFLQNQNGGRRKLQRLSKPVWKAEWIFALANQFVSDSEIHRATQGTHSCYLSVNGELRFSAEDIGRHNALDKAIGYAVMRGFKQEDCILYTTGQVSIDMARKVIMSGFPVLVSKSVPTNAAVQLAHANNMVLICKAWPDQFEVFNDAE